MSLTAITRQVSPSINDCELSFHERQKIEIVRAIAQHTAYEECLSTLGVQIVSLPAEPDLPDAVFVEDTAVVLDEIAIITNMGAASRRAEPASVAQALAQYRPLQFLVAPATLDGGDVMRVGRRLFVGVSRRTNRAGLTQLTNFVRPYGYEVEPVEVRGCLHLKSACSCLDNHTILVNPRWIDAQPLRGFELLNVDENEPGAGNALVTNQVIVMPASFPNTCDLLSDRGFRIMTLDISELQKAEAGVTCCSLIFERGAGGRI